MFNPTVIEVCLTLLRSAVAVGFTATFAATVRVKMVGAIGAGLPAWALTVTLKALYLVEGGTVIVKRVVLPLRFGVTLAGVNEQVVPIGRLVRSHANVTLLAISLGELAMIVVEPGFPGVSLTPPELERV